jgi:hypothetical protein
VFGVDHPYMGRIALPDGEVTEPTESQFHSPAEVVAYYAKDLEFVIGLIAELNRANPEKTFTGKFDMARIAAIGHSSGFVAASGACKLDSRIKACINIDVARFWCERSCGVGTAAPLDSAPKGRRCTCGVSEAVYELQIQGANHGSVEDWDYLEAPSPAQREAANKILQIIRQYVEAFLSKHLNRENSDLLEPGSGKPGLQWRVYVPAASSNSSPKQP